MIHHVACCQRPTSLSAQYDLLRALSRRASTLLHVPDTYAWSVCLVVLPHECSLYVYVRSCGAQWSVCLGALVSLLGPLVTGVKPDLT